MATNENEKQQDTESEQKQQSESPFLSQQMVTRAEGFAYDYTIGRFAEMTCKLKLVHPIELNSTLHSFHQGVARDLDYNEFSRYIEFCLEEVARYWLKVDHARFGKLMAEARIRGHAIQDCELAAEPQP